MKMFRNYRLTTVLTIVIVVLSLIPTQSLPKTDFRMADKWVHLLMYFLLACTMWWERCRSTQEKPMSGFAAWTVVFPTALGILMELAQAYLTTYRGGDWTDAVANALGALLAMPAGLLVTRHYNSRRK